MTTINITIEGATKSVRITDEHAASSYGVPVAVVDGEAYGPTENLPIWPEDDLSWLVEPASVTVAAAVLHGDSMSATEKAFVRRFYAV